MLYAGRVKFASSLARDEATDRATGEAIDSLREQLTGHEPHLLCAFVSAHHEARYLSIAERLRREFARALLFGCSARSVLAEGREAEEAPGIALVGAELPGVTLLPFHAAGGKLPELPVPSDAHALLLADPWSSELESLLPALDARLPEGTKLGGVASGAQQPGRNLLFLGDGAARSGVIGVTLHGALRLDAVVAQGCRPVGQPLFVTGSSGNTITQLDGSPPLDVLRALFDAATPKERELFQHSLFLGVEMRSAQGRYEAGDFLIRNLLGTDAETGAVHVAAELSGARVVQFHLRDASAASADLDRRLAADIRQGGQAAGALLFSCLGRGEGLYGIPDHDSGLFMAKHGEVPIGGFFCNGEIGPVQQQTFLHGYTSAIGIFRAPPPRAS